MSAPQRRTWAGFVLAIVPVDDLEVDLRPLCQAAARRVAGDPALAETVEIGLTREVNGETADEPMAVARVLAKMGLRDGEPLAPTMVFSVLVVGARLDRANWIANGLAETRIGKQFRIHQFARSTVDADLTVADVLDTLEVLRAQHERWPDDALSAEDFRTLMAPRPAPAPTPTPTPAPAPALSSSSSTPVVEHVPEEPANTARTFWSNTVGRVRSILPQPPPTQRESMDRLADRPGGVALVYFVLAPDLSPVSRTVRNRRRDLVVEIDAAFGRLLVAGLPFQVSVLAGDRPRGAVVPAGGPGGPDVPKVEVGHFDLAARVEQLLAARERDIASLRRRGTTVTRTDVVLISTHAPLADIDAVERFRELCDEARVSWILLDVDVDLLSEEFEAAGAEIFEDHPDVINALMTAAVGTGRPDEEPLPLDAD
ncbi:hypothetical protein [Actinoplanes sp. NPDC051411]|uniref:hypothetical protein n=1 Tax=Actinoplanes sp. NPDC051411 TaxID=3155522 RepID=UPI00343F688A